MVGFAQPTRPFLLTMRGWSRPQNGLEARCGPAPRLQAGSRARLTDVARTR
ncbi:hypothetical protein EDF19_1364 [Curtobacterium sp. PhB115]|nr:hypothetical protein EDF19_1364 [Curtobacterium sp. PhB115]